LHLVGGLGALLYGCWRVRRFSRADRAAALAPLAIYWHFVGVLWLYVFALLSST
jgi:heme/copper-type cytochrome/quinol oxidase subunit 3